MSNYGWSTGATGYDDEDRLVSWARDDNTLSQSWTLTSEGDWSQFVENTTTENRTHAPAHERESISVGGNQYNLGHDVKGNLTDIPSGLRPTASRLPPVLGLRQSDERGRYRRRQYRRRDAEV